MKASIRKFNCGRCKSEASVIFKTTLDKEGIYTSTVKKCTSCKHQYGMTGLLMLKETN